MRRASMAVCLLLAALAVACDRNDPADGPDAAEGPAPAVPRGLPAAVARKTGIRSIQTHTLRLLPSADGVLAVATYLGGGSTKGGPGPQRSGSAAWWCAGPPCSVADRPGPMPDSDPVPVDDGAGVVYALLRTGASTIDLARCDPTGCRPHGSVGLPVQDHTVLEVEIDGPDLVLLHRPHSPGATVGPGARELWLARCPIAACASGWSSHRILVSTVTTAESNVELAVRDGLPVVAHFSGYGPATVLLCADRDCATVARRTDIAGAGTSYLPMLRILAGGRIAILADITLTTCDDRNCTTASVVRLPDGRGQAAYRSQIAVARTGNPLVVTTDTSGDVLLRECADPACHTSSSVVVGTNSPGNESEVAVTVGPGGMPLVGWISGKTLTLVTCRTAGCR